MKPEIPAAALDQIFRTARTYRRSADAWLPEDVPDELLRRAYDLAKLGPTSANCSPARIVFVRSPAAKAKLREALSPDNVEQTMAAPVTAIVGSDHGFPRHLGRLYKEQDAVPWFAGKPEVIANTAFRNATLQGAYLIIALRAVGLDCGPMSGFNTAAVDAAFFAGTEIHANFLINIGCGNPSVLRSREDRLNFEEACRID